jgi:uncharacterized UPF0146 family protein
MYKPSIIITNGKKNEISRELEKSNFDLSKIDILEQKENLY